MTKFKRKFMILAIVLTVGLMLILWDNLTVGLTEITIREANLPMAFYGYRIAHVSDLHNSHLWKQTVKQLEKMDPDIICITGDIVDSNHTDIDVALAFVAEAVKVAPCYYVVGNHELVLNTADYEKLMSGIQSLGAVILDDEAVTLQRGDAHIYLAGIPWGSSSYQGKLSENEEYQILLSHDPKHFESYTEAGYDLVLCGHVHGGQFRLPFIGGLYGPGQGLLPEYDSGVYSSLDTDMVVSRGIGNSVFPIRFNNRPEVILITLKTA